MSILDRLWCRLCLKCPVPEFNDDDDLKRLERAQAVVSFAQRQMDIDLRNERALSERRRENDPPQGRNG